MTATTRVLRKGLHFGECPRWYDDRLWYSDFYDGAVHAIDLDGVDERIVEVPGQPAGLGWLPDGRLLIVARKDRKLVTWDGSVLAPYADLTDVFPSHGNDMVVDDQGRAYVGNFGCNLDALKEQYGREALFGEPGVPGTVMARVDPDGSVSVATDGLKFPNGAVITPDGSALIVAETYGRRLTAYDVSTDGDLSNRRVWADLASDNVAPDGICLDADGGIWVANPGEAHCVRVIEGGEITDRVETNEKTFACMLGGLEGRDLFIVTAPDSREAVASQATSGAIEVVTVDVPHAGLP
ncbi:sugar lactone lactonase YvrE [Antricoccus suffuscus]|uniref:Sugar lactone lactonase YvrE n=1 Tax=Antricoccus suffuscus TaxID=1629062 RepID=A0A2T0ZYW9_9ACTN|nr:SMP-30/gluconolactonase/LRE family protein [Antricoccus suffuscus]PRZ41533.1 sugar lactone lactonase YvrE [Antricoccus suffuscus]